MGSSCRFFHSIRAAYGFVQFKCVGIHSGTVFSLCKHHRLMRIKRIEVFLSVYVYVCTSMCAQMHHAHAYTDNTLSTCATAPFHPTAFTAVAAARITIHRSLFLLLLLFLSLVCFVYCLPTNQLLGRHSFSLYFIHWSILICLESFS